MRIFKTFIANVLIASGALATEAIAQMQAPPPVGQRPPPIDAETLGRGKDKTVEGQVRSIDPLRTEIVLTDGTRLIVPGDALRPGVLSEGATVVATYREEDGNKVLTGLVVLEPSASPSTEPRSPRESPAGPPGSSPKRY
jgi:hypothetical protein